MIEQRWKDAKEGNANWRTEAAEAYKFVVGHQWDSDDEKTLDEEGRPCITFNRCDVFIDAVCGLEVNNRQSIHFFPREKGDTGVNEVLTAAGKWCREGTDAESEESEAFRDAAICGIGVVRSRMDYTEDAEGKYLDDRIDPLQVWVDPTARKRGLKDRRYHFHGEYMDREEANEKWPDKVLPLDSPEAEPNVINTDSNWLYKDEENSIYETKDKVFILYYEEVRKEPVYVLLNPLTGKLEELDSESFQKVKKLVQERGIKYVKREKNCYYRTFCNANGEPLEELEKSPIQDFTYKFITYKRDRSKSCWYGLVRHMKDPQRWANKWLSQILHIINTNAKGGAFAEAGAFADAKKAEEQWSQSSPLILLREGGIEKIKERQQAAYPSGLDRLMMLAFDSLPYVTGVNLEILGLADREQAGVLEAQRRQSAFAILAPLFDALRQFRKERGKLLLDYIRTFLADGRLIRIIGKNGAAQYIPLALEEDTKQYDVIVDQSPDSPDFKKQLWEMLQVMLPAMMKAGYPIPPSVIQYIPNLPMDLAQEWMDFVTQSSQGPSPEQMQQLQELVQKSQEEIQKLKEENMKLKMDGTLDLMKLKQKSDEAQMKAGMKMEEIQAESYARQMEIAINAQIERASLAIEAKMDMVKAIFDAQIKAFQAQMKAETETRKVENEAKKEEKAPITVNVDTKSDMKQMINDQVKSIEKIVGPLADKVDQVSKKKKKQRIKRVADGYEVEEV